jgi:CRP/FNR family cyclic AMP-dependent transcriptional regulator
MKKALHLMKFLDDIDTEWLVRHGDRTRLPHGAVLVTEGQPLDSLFIVLDGCLSVRVGGAGGVEIARLEAGEIIGEISFVDSRPPTATVSVLQDASVLCVSRDRLRQKLADDLGFSSRFYQGIGAFLADRLRTTVSRLGYGDRRQDLVDPDLLDEPFLDGVTMAAARFDKILRQSMIH